MRPLAEDRVRSEEKPEAGKIGGIALEEARKAEIAGALKHAHQ